MSAVRDLADYMDTVESPLRGDFPRPKKQGLDFYWYCGVYLDRMSEEYASNIMQTRHTYGA